MASTPSSSRSKARRPSARNPGGWLARWLLPATAVPGVLIAMVFPVAAPAGARPHHGGGAPGYCRSGGPELWENLAACGWPGAANSCLEISGMVYVRARNVVIKDTTIVSNSGRLGTRANGTAGITVAAGASAIVDHVTVDGENGVHACIWDEGTRLTVNALNCYGADDGVFSWSQSQGQWHSGSNFTIANSYFHGFTHATSNGHEDGYQTEGASNGLIEHNTFQLGPHADSAIAIWDSRASSRDITVAGNLITGGGFAIYAEDYNPGTGGPGSPPAGGGMMVSGIQFTGNVFSTFAAGCAGKYGVWFTRPGWSPYHGGPTDGWHRSGNRVLETGERIDTGNPHDGGALCR